jgi:hypothetical protein
MAAVAGILDARLAFERKIRNISMRVHAHLVLDFIGPPATAPEEQTRAATTSQA